MSRFESPHARPALHVVGADDAGQPVTGRAVVEELVELLADRLPHVSPTDPQHRMLTDLRDVLAATLLSPARRA